MHLTIGKPYRRRLFDAWTSWARKFPLFPLILAVCWTPGYAGEPEQVSIQIVFAQASSYESHLVTLQGVVSDLRVTPPIPAPGLKCPLLYGQATFTLDDGTGSLPVGVLGACLRPEAAVALPKNGDMVRMTAFIHLLNRDVPVRLFAQATTMMILYSQ
jgi:hypothetical protein